MTDPMTFEAPGPGTWQRDDTHVVGAMTTFMQVHFTPLIRAGLAEGFRRYGVMVDHIDFAHVAGRMYGRVRPIGAPEPKEGKTPPGPPPKAVLTLLFVLHPEMRRRKRAAVATLAEKRWRGDRARWRSELAPRFRARNLELQEVDPDALDDEALRAHLVACLKTFESQVVAHFTQQPASYCPVGDFVAQVCEWTGCQPSEAVAALQGSNPASTEPLALLDPLARAVADDPTASSVVRGTKPAAERLEALRASSPKVRVALEAYLREHGLRVVTGFDVDDLTLLEMPETILNSIVARIGAEGSPGFDEAPHEAARTLRSRVPVDRRLAFDELLDDARAAYGLHDEDVGITCQWPLGLVRRAMLVAGQRLADRGAFEEPSHVLECTVDEVDTLLAGEPGPSAAELAERARARVRLSALEPPMRFGPEIEPPSPDLFPEPVARVMRGMLTYLALADFGVEAETAHDAGLVRGMAASSGSYEGVARIVSSPTEFERIEEGDVLVAPVTSPVYNVVLPLLGAVVTDRGGALCHAAIVAREFGIPAVVGTRDATKRIPDGARVRVDGGTGQVQVLS